MSDKEPIARLRIDLAYDGGPFRGFARQPDVPTVQAVVEDHLARVFDQQVATFCAGRTDAGVHALGQVVHVDVFPTKRAIRALASLDDDPHDFRLQLDHQVKEAITVWWAERVDPSFDARHSANERRYRYVISDTRGGDPRLRGVQWQLRSPLDEDVMHDAGQYLLGENDYRSFCRLGDTGHTRRRLDEVTVSRSAEGLVHVTLRGPAFCHQLCRAIVGCLVEVGRHEYPPSWIGKVLGARDRSLAAPVSPPQGLTLEGVGYPDPWPDAPNRTH